MNANTIINQFNRTITDILSPLPSESEIKKSLNLKLNNLLHYLHQLMDFTNAENRGALSGLKVKILIFQTRMSLSLRKINIIKCQQICQNFKIVKLLTRDNSFSFIPAIFINCLPQSYTVIKSSELPEHAIFRNPTHQQLSSFNLKYRLSSYTVREGIKTLNKLEALNVVDSKYREEIASFALATYSLDEIQKVIQKLPFSFINALICHLATDPLAQLNFLKKLDQKKISYELFLKSKQINKILPHIQYAISLTIESEERVLPRLDHVIHLKKLVIKGDLIEDFNSLGKLQKLEFLDIENKRVSFISLEGLESVNTLYIHDSPQLSILLGISKLSCLKELKLSNVGLTNLNFIEKLGSLITLEIKHCEKLKNNLVKKENSLQTT